MKMAPARQSRSPLCLSNCSTNKQSLVCAYFFSADCTLMHLTAFHNPAKSQCRSAPFHCSRTIIAVATMVATSNRCKTVRWTCMHTEYAHSSNLDHSAREAVGWACNSTGFSTKQVQSNDIASCVQHPLMSTKQPWSTSEGLFWLQALYLLAWPKRSKCVTMYTPFLGGLFLPLSTLWPVPWSFQSSTHHSTHP